MSKIEFKSAQDMLNHASDGTLLQEEFVGKIRRMFKHLRETRGLSVPAVSRATGIKEETIEMIEKGRKVMRWGLLARLMRYYGIWVKLSFISQPKEIKFDELEIK